MPGINRRDFDPPILLSKAQLYESFFEEEPSPSMSRKVDPVVAIHATDDEGWLLVGDWPDPDEMGGVYLMPNGHRNYGGG